MGISERAFLVSLSSAALIVFHFQYCIFLTSGSQLLLMWQASSLDHPSPRFFSFWNTLPKNCTLEDKHLIFIPIYLLDQYAGC